VCERVTNERALALQSGAALKRLIDESFEVAVSPSLTWDHLAQVENWPTWAKHIKSVVRTPAGPLSIDTQATVRLTNGMTSTFKMIEFAPPFHWKWSGSLLVSPNLLRSRFSRDCAR
jgi:hypothetical protein